MKYKVGDKFIYGNSNHLSSTFGVEAGRLQMVISIRIDIDFVGSNDLIIKTIFLDTGEYNEFLINSDYSNKCVIVTSNIKNNLIEYENGIPLEWGDNV